LTIHQPQPQSDIQPAFSPVTGRSKSELSMRQISILSFALTLSFAALAHADVIYSVSLNTAPLIGNPNGPFLLDFQLTDGGGTGDGNNSATLSQFQFGAGGSAGNASTITLTNNASGNLASSVSLKDTSFFNEFSQAFVPGATFTFQLDLTANADAGGTPDEFTFQLLDASGNEVSTNDPSGSNALLIIDITGSALQPQTFTTTGDGFSIGPVLSASPEPATVWTAITGAAFVLFVRRYPARLQSLTAFFVFQIASGKARPSGNLMW
jgi:hypothetical protein